MPFCYLKICSVTRIPTAFLQHAIYIAYNGCSSRQLDALERRKAIHKEVKKIPSNTQDHEGMQNKNKIMGDTMTANNLISAKEIKPLDKRTKREILELLCNQKGWDIKSDIATSCNRASKNVLLEWLKDLV